MVQKLFIALAVVLASLSISPTASSAKEIANDHGVRVTTNGSNQVTVFTRPQLWGKPMRVEFVAQDQESTALKTVTPSRNSPSFTVKGLNRKSAYRIDSPAMKRPIVFRLTTLSNTSTAKNADTKPNPPSGNRVLQTVADGNGNSDWYVNPYFFSEVGQTFRMTRKSAVNAVALRFSSSVTTLLTPQGVELMKNPSQIDWSDPKTQGIEIFNNDPNYSFPATVTVRLYADVKNPRSESITPGELSEIAYSSRKVRISHNGFLTLPIPRTELTPGSYFLSVGFTDVPKNVLSIFLRGQNHGGPKNRRDAYKLGQAYQVRDATQGELAFDRATTKRQPVSAVGKDVFDPGDLVILLLDTAR